MWKREGEPPACLFCFLCLGIILVFIFPEICALFHKLLLISKEALIFPLTTENLRILTAKIINLDA